MSLLSNIDKDLAEALKAREREKVTVLRGLKSDIKYRRIDKGEDLTDDEVVSVLSSCAKKCRESLSQFEQAGREDLVRKTEFELDIIKNYLPSQLGEDELRQIIQAAIDETGADSPQKIGLVMKAVMPKVQGRADGKLVNKLAAEMLAK